MTPTLGRKVQRLYIPVALVLVSLLYIVVQNQYQIRNTLSYATRPLWDTAYGPKSIVAHYYSDGMAFDEHTCGLHGWKKRTGDGNLRVLDAVLMSSELDLLEIRLNELDSIVDQFLIVESNATFTGLPKETFFRNNRERFARFEEKISYRLYAVQIILRTYSYLT